MFCKLSDIRELKKFVFFDKVKRKATYESKTHSTIEHSKDSAPVCREAVPSGREGFLDEFKAAVP